MSKFKKQMPQNIITRELKNNRTFSYNKKGVNLAFTLSLDDDEQLKIYLELLEVAKQDVAQTLEEITGV